MATLPTSVPAVRIRFCAYNSGLPHYADITADFAPVTGDTAVFHNEVPTTQLPAEYAAAAWEGIRAALDGTPASVRLTAGGYLEVDSREQCFRIAGRLVGRLALVRAGLLPPEATPDPRWIG